MASTDVPFVTFVCAKDVHYGKALIGSLKWRYPGAVVHVVADTDTPAADVSQMRRVDGVVVHRVADLIAQHGFEFRGLLSKFNVFYLPGVDRAVVVDSDSVCLDDVVSKIDLRDVYVSLHGHAVDIADPAARASYERWAVQLGALPALGGVMPPGPVRFVSGSHFYLNVGEFPRELVSRLFPLLGLTHGHDGPLRAGDQGFWNFVVNFEPSLHERVSVQSLTWDADRISPAMSESAAARTLLEHERSVSAYSFIHYIGYCRQFLLGSHRYSKALTTATGMYYSLLEGAGTRQIDFIRRAGSMGLRRLRRIASRPSP